MIGFTSTTLLAGIALALTATSSLRAEERMRAGLWENTVTSDGKTTSRTRCVLPAETALANRSLKEMREATEKSLAKTAAGKCTLKELRSEGNTTTSVLVCGPSTFSNTTIYRGDTFETSATKVTAGQVSVSILKGKRIGDCP